LRENLPDVAALLDEMNDRFVDAVTSDISLREVLIRTYELQNCESIGFVLESDLPMTSVFYLTAKQLGDGISARLNVRADLMASVIQRITPYAAPGYALNLAVRRARALHPMPDTAGDAVDLDHLMFAPYVDLAFVDKRTFAFVQQEAKRHSDRLPADSTWSVRKAGTLDAVLNAVLSEAR
jgi:hypothetical protein